MTPYVIHYSDGTRVFVCRAGDAAVRRVTRLRRGPIVRITDVSDPNRLRPVPLDGGSR
jgi:hypothetical protein